MADLIAMLGAAAGAAAGGGEVDPNFNQTVLLLHGDGTDGAQNNTFLDSSTNNFTITRNGNTTQGTFSPFSQDDGKWGAYFDGSGDTISAPSDTAFDLGSGDFTMEAWIFPTSYGASYGIIFARYSGGGASNQPFFVSLETNGTVRAGINGTYALQTTSTAPLNTWTHVAWSRSGNNFTIWLNGVSSATLSQSVTLNNPSLPTFIGAFGSLSSNYFTGYISNARIVKGTAVYTSNFTPSTTPLTAITNTSLLTCQSNRFKDNSTNAFAITVNGNTSVQPFSPFAPSAAYSPSVNGGSGYFDGTGDYLTLSPDSVFRPSGDFTLEVWIYIPNVSGLKNILATLDASSTYSLNLAVNNANARFILGPFAGGAYAVNMAAGTIAINTWTHIAVARSGSGSNNIRMWLNGSSVAQATSTATPNTEISVDIGRENFAGGNVFNGYMSGLRLVTGSAAYDPANSTITVPTAPPTAITNTSLLCNFTNAGIFDNTGKNNLETVGNAQIDTTVKKYGTGSMEFDGTGDYLVAPSSPNTILSGNFTVEGWIYITTLGNNFLLFGIGDDATSTGISLFVNSAGRPRVLTNNAYAAEGSDGNVSAATWTHVALVRSSSTITIYVDGSSVGTGTVSATLSGALYVGAENYSGTVYPTIAGFIDDLRISRVARYTTTFTPPTKAFPDL